MPAKRCGKLFSEITEVVYLTVVGEDETAARRDHRLMPFAGEVDDGKPPVSEPDSRCAIPPVTGVVRSPVAQGGTEPGEQPVPRQARVGASKTAGDSAHT